MQARQTRFIKKSYLANYKYGEQGRCMTQSVTLPAGCFSIRHVFSGPPPGGRRTRRWCQHHHLPRRRPRRGHLDGARWCQHLRISICPDAPSLHFQDGLKGARRGGDITSTSVCPLCLLLLRSTSRGLRGGDITSTQ